MASHQIKFKSLKLLFGNALLLCALAGPASAQNYGIPLWGNPYRASAATPAPTPAPGATPVTVTPSLPIPVFAVNIGYTVAKSITTTASSVPVTATFDRNVRYFMRNSSPNAASSNYFYFERRQGSRAQESGAGIQDVRTGTCAEGLALQASQNCWAGVSRSTFTDDQERPEVQAQYQPWASGEISSRPYICHVAQYIGSDGTLLATPNQYHEENRISIFVEGAPTSRFRVRFKLQASAVTPDISSLFSAQNLTNSMTPRSYSALRSSTLQVTNFTLLPGSDSTFEGIVYGNTPTPIFFSGSPSMITRNARGAVMSDHNCLTYSVSNPMVLQALGD